MHARSLALNDGKTEIILGIVDARLIPREVCEQARAIACQTTGVPAKKILISATHSHRCAALTPEFQSDPDPAYMTEVPGRIAQGLIQAHANLAPAEIAWTKASDPTQVFNRRWLMKPGQTYENPFASTGDRAHESRASEPPRKSSFLATPTPKSDFGRDRKKPSQPLTPTLNQGCF